MSAPTKTHRIKRQKKIAKTKLQSRSIPWREAAKKEIDQYSEGGLMLRGARSKKEITQKKLAEALSISQHHISEMENGKRPIGKAMAKRFAEFFETNYKVFL